ncbi:MAG: hypothetical protein ACYDBT_02440 [Desulfobulbaceae bacterium]
MDTNILARLDRFCQALFEKLLWRNLYIFAAMLFLLLVLAWSTTFDLVLRQDAFFYTMTGMEIAHGDFVLNRLQAAGWPFFLAFFYFLFGTDNIFQAMFWARWISILLVCVSVVPMMVLCRRICDKEQWQGACVVAVTAYVFSGHIREIAKVAYTEPLFLFLTLCCLCFLAAREQPATKTFALAALFAGLSYWVRANGLFHLFLILGMVTIWSAGRIGYLVKNGLTAIGVFAAVSAPHLIMRHLQFGSPFDYGPNSKYFVDSFVQVWDDAVPSPSLMEYLATHTWQNYFEKFIGNGLFQVFYDFTGLLDDGHFWLALLCVSLAFAVLRGRKEMFPLVLLFGLTLAGFSLVFDVFGHIRHLLFLIPFILLGSVAFVASLSGERFRVGNILLVVLLVHTVASHEKIEILAKNRIKLPQVQDTWALWAADHLEGNVVLLTGGDILRLAQHYRKPAVDRIPLSFAQVEERIVRIRPGEYSSLAEAVADFRKKEIDFVITDAISLRYIRRNPYLKEIGEEKWRNIFVHQRSFAGGEPGASYHGVNIYRFNDTQPAAKE